MNWPNLQRVVADVIRTGDDVRRGVEDTVTRQVDRVASWAIPLAVEAVVSRVDLTDLVARHVDLDALVANVDINAVAYRLDLLGIAQYVIDGVDLPDIVRSSSASLTTEAVHRVRIRGADADTAISRAVDRIKPHRHNGNARITEPAG